MPKFQDSCYCCSLDIATHHMMMMWSPMYFGAIEPLPLFIGNKAAAKINNAAAAAMHADGFYIFRKLLHICNSLRMTTFACVP